MNAINMMIAFILSMIALFFTAGCSTTEPSKKHYIQMLYEGGIRPQEDIAIVLTSIKGRPHGNEIKLKILDIDGIKITEIITEVTPGVHNFNIQCKSVIFYPN